VNTEVQRPTKTAPSYALVLDHTLVLRLANGETRVVTRKWWKKFLKSLP
jgi:hypothetical protein